MHAAHDGPVTAAEAARLTGLAIETVRRWLDAGRLPVVFRDAGGCRRVPAGAGG